MATTTRFVVKNGLDNNSKTLLNIGSSGSELSFSGGHPVTFTSTGTSTLTLPTSGTLAITTDIKDASLTLAWVAQLHSLQTLQQVLPLL